jgi:DeoR family transcriptional regulator, copper-sensing transcriptional repressor
MKQTPERRREIILERLRQSGRLSMDQIVKDLGVSIMTANRDVRQLEEDGLIRRERGGIAMPAPSAKPDVCFMCRRQVPDRTRFLFSDPNGEISTACCPHCGISRLVGQNPANIFATDFLYGTLVSANAATYVIGSSVKLCCAPSVLSFENQEDAQRFQNGFGGELMDLQTTFKRLTGGNPA